MQLDLSKYSLLDICHEDLLSQWKNVLTYHSLIVLMGPVVESVALRDKKLYLLEKGRSLLLYLFVNSHIYIPYILLFHIHMLVS